eukprot:12133004-Alexandrium_andersonii.AAC.1
MGTELGAPVGGTERLSIPESGPHRSTSPGRAWMKVQRDFPARVHPSHRRMCSPRPVVKGISFFWHRGQPPSLGASGLPA